MYYVISGVNGNLKAFLTFIYLLVMSIYKDALLKYSEVIDLVNILMYTSVTSSLSMITAYRF